MRYRFLQGLALGALAALSLQVGCVDKGSTSNAGSAPLYVFDGTTNSILAWNDISAIYDAGSATAANRTITSAKIGSSFVLGWGGMAFDSANQRLYLVSTTGQVIRILRTGTQNGDVSTTNGDIISFTLTDTGSDAAGGDFGQAAVDSQGNLFITQCIASSGQSQIWSIPYSAQSDGTSLSYSNYLIAETSDTAADKYCTGVAIGGSNNVYAFANDGNNPITPNLSSTQYNGPRLRSGSKSGFAANQQVIVGSTTTTLLGQYGCLAFDIATNNGLLYFARQSSADPVLVYTPGKFNPGFEVGPSSTLQGPANGLLRIISHARQKDWLVGAEAETAGDNTAGAGTSTLWIWKAPSAGDTHVSMTLPGSVKILGLALDGSN